MNRIVCCVLTVLLGASLAGASPPSEPSKGADRLVVHEWGTFTSVSGAKGTALEWRPLGGKDDLPSFVYSNVTRTTGQGLRFGEVCPGCDHPSCACGKNCAPVNGRCKCKGCVRSTVRMETPVIYFYTERERKIRVKVGFPQGQITEWYPQARSVNEGIDWGTVLLRPGAKVTLPKEPGPSHYYPAREVDAVPVQVCGRDPAKKGPETERFLFYRGVGTFDLPLAARFRGKSDLELANFGKLPLQTLIVFERKGDRVGVRVIQPKCSAGVAPRDTRRVALPLTSERTTFSATAGVAKVRAVLEQLLVAEGLYAKEARAMVETWADHWFEDGLRAFYLVPRERTDELLPLTLDPKPDELVRVLVGRLEMITPALRQRVRELALGLVSEDPTRRAAAVAQFAREGR
ncbi:MAG: hypothetical protein JKY65_27545, partial [Planctomycetes bacterium]|nr:hypothetical protein [Planctomycetota bacterium]